MLSAVIITRDEERNIARCLRSLAWVDEIVVVDSASTDGTREIAAEHGARVVDIPWQGFGPTKQAGVDAATHDWVLSIDADEEVTPELRAAIEAALADPAHHGWFIRRRSFYLGRAIRHSGWHDDAPLRLFHRGHGRFDDKQIHEAVHVDGAVGVLDGLLLHHTYPDLASHLAKIDTYSALTARQLHDRGRRASIVSAILRGNWKFWSMYVMRLGFLDGREGLVLAFMSAYGITLKYLRLWELGARGSADGS